MSPPLPVYDEDELRQQQEAPTSFEKVSEGITALVDTGTASYLQLNGCLIMATKQLTTAMDVALTASNIEAVHSDVEITGSRKLAPDKKVPVPLGSELGGTATKKTAAEEIAEDADMLETGDESMADEADEESPVKAPPKKARPNKTALDPSKKAALGHVFKDVTEDVRRTVKEAPQTPRRSRRHVGEEDQADADEIAMNKQAGPRKARQL